MPATRLSRYEYASIHQDECSRLYLDVPEPVVLKRSKNEDILYFVSQAESLHNLAFRFYKDMLVTNPLREIRPSRFYWVIAQANDIIDPTAELEAGTQLLIPGLGVLNEEILSPPPYTNRDRFVSS